MKIRTDGRVWLSVDELGDALASEMRAALTIKRRIFTPGASSKFKAEPMQLYSEIDGMIGVPRDWFRRESRLTHEVELDVSLGRPLGKLACEYSPWNDEQAKALRVISESLLEQVEKHGFGGGILKARTGWGKTCVVTMLIAMLDVTFAVMISNEKLAKQWKKDLLRGIPSLRLGTVQQDKCQFGDDYDGTICTMPSLYARTNGSSKKPYPEALFRWPGFLLVDEGHRVAANSWANLVARFTARLRLMASATPRRSDGTERVFFDHVGQILFNGEVEYLKAEVRVNKLAIRTPWSIPRETDDGDDRPGVELHESRVIAWLMKQRAFMDRLVAEISRAVAAGRHVLALANDLDLLQALAERMSPDLDGQIGICAGSWPDASTSSGRRLVSQTEFESGLEKRLVLSTFGMFKEGISVETLDTLFVLAPQGDLEQAAGRILRKTDKVPNKRPVIVEFDFGDLLWQRRLAKRLKYYESRGYKIGRPT